jgi:hypothetical protein
MNNNRQPWMQVPATEVPLYLPLAQAFCPAVRLKPGDMWKNLRCHFRVAILKPPHRGRHVSRICFGFHLAWDIPDFEDIVRRHPTWSMRACERAWEGFKKHEKHWGPGDVEMVRLIIQRQPTDIDLDILDPSQFVNAEISYRSGANPEGVIKRLLSWQWDKLARYMVFYHQGLKEFSWFRTRDGRIELCIDSYHHSFFEAGQEGHRKIRWRQVIVPEVSHFTDELWQHFQVSEKKRSFMDWEVS